MVLATSRNPREIARTEKDLQGPPFPEPLRYLWKAYRRLARRTGSNGFGANPISFEAIDFYSRRILHLDPWEIEIIEMLDDLARVDREKKPPPEQDGPGSP